MRTWSAGYGSPVKNERQGELRTLVLPVTFALLKKSEITFRADLAVKSFPLVFHEKTKIGVCNMKQYDPCLRLLTAKEAAELCNVSESCIRQWVTRGYLKSVASYRKSGAKLYMENHVLEVERARRMARSSEESRSPSVRPT